MTADSLTAVAPRPLSLGERSGLFVAEARHHALLIGFMIGYAAVVLVVMSAHGLSWHFASWNLLMATLLVPVLIVVFRTIGELARHVFHVRPFRVRGVLLDVWHSEVFDVRYVATAVIPMVLLPIFSTFFTSFKQSIAVINPFHWDETLMQWDAALHFGVHPWELLLPVLGHPVVIAVISYLYNVWMPVMYLIFCLFAITRSERVRRMHFLLSYFLTWTVLGSGFAYLFSSAGPCYFHEFVAGPNPYAPLFQHLNEGHESIPNMALLGQEYLWNGYEANQARAGGGISAMPSLHVAIATLWALFAWSRGPVLRSLTVLYLAIIMVGSVLLGWHYAIDGYAGAFGAVVMYWVAGLLTRRVVPAAPVDGPGDEGAGPGPGGMRHRLAERGT
ncbi:phosphatase PAP2 family protein [Roseospira navarrensis]|uniref:phosphatase PAP2 family protein n=1 Tax=Roseospira navarrensis TaxID=140058 RepID=UPI0014798005